MEAATSQWQIRYADLSKLFTVVYPKILGRLWRNQDDLDDWVRHPKKRIDIIRDAGLHLPYGFPIFPRPEHTCLYKVTNHGVYLPSPTIPIPRRESSSTRALELLIARYLLFTNVFQMPAYRGLPEKPPVHYPKIPKPHKPKWSLTAQQLRSIMLAVPRLIAIYWLDKLDNPGGPPLIDMTSKEIRHLLRQLFEVVLDSFFTGKSDEGKVMFYLLPALDEARLAFPSEVLIDEKGIRFPLSPPGSLTDIYASWQDGSAQNSVITITPVTS